MPMMMRAGSAVSSVDAADPEKLQDRVYQSMRVVHELPDHRDDDLRHRDGEEIRQADQRATRNLAVQEKRQAQREEPFGERDPEHVCGRDPERLVEERVFPEHLVVPQPVEHGRTRPAPC